MSALKTVLTTSLIASLSFTAQARWFEVEVLLFARNLDPTQLDEDFSKAQFKPMRIRTMELLNSELLAPSDCPEPEPEKAEEDLPGIEQAVQYDEYGFPIEVPANPDDEIALALLKEEERAKPIAAAIADIEAGVTLDEFGLPIDPNAKTPEEQAAHSQWLLNCQKPKAMNEFDYLPLTIAAQALPDTDSAPYLLPEVQLQLTEAYSKLTQSHVYQPLLHTGWRMDIQGRRQMPAIRLVAGKNYGQTFSSDGWEHLEPPHQDIESTLPQTQEVDASAFTEEGAVVGDRLLFDTTKQEKEPRREAVWEMQTDIRIWLASWLHMETQSTLRRQGLKEPVALNGLNDESVQSQGSLVMESASKPYLYSYHMDQFRRVRSQEIHYFDHPLMGMIIQIRPYSPRDGDE